MGKSKIDMKLEMKHIYQTIADMGDVDYQTREHAHLVYDAIYLLAQKVDALELSLERLWKNVLLAKTALKHADYALRSENVACLDDSGNDINLREVLEEIEHD